MKIELNSSNQALSTQVTSQGQNGPAMRHGLTSRQNTHGWYNPYHGLPGPFTLGLATSCPGREPKGEQAWLPKTRASTVLSIKV